MPKLKGQDLVLDVLTINTRARALTGGSAGVPIVRRSAALIRDVDPSPMYRRHVTRVQYFTACTLDGFIADENHSLDWLFDAPHSEDDDAWDEFIGGVGPMVMGSSTYEWVLRRYDLLANPQQWHDFYADRPCWVFSHRDLPRIPTATVRIVSGDVRPVYEEMVTALPGKNIWIVGGGDLAGQFDDADLLDEVWLGMRPVFLGAGAPLLPRRITTRRVTLREVRHAGQQLQLILDVARHN